MALLQKTFMSSMRGTMVLLASAMIQEHNAYSNGSEVNRLQLSMRWKSREVRKERPLPDLTSSTTGFDTRIPAT